ncbi:MAG: phage major capsid protein [Planctomycetes bacterium]|nr:phage major capsid protein [Planctomycetota bacterium]
MKWLVLLKDWSGQCAGAKIQVAEADAATLISSGIARDCSENENPDVRVADELAGKLGKAVADAVKKAVDGAVNRLTSLVPPAEPRNETAEAKGGFDNFGEFAACVKSFQERKSIDNRIAAIVDRKAPSGLNEGIDSEGGILVPPEYVDRVLEKIHSPQDILARTENLTIRGNSIRLPIEKERSRATGSRGGGVRGYWVEEGSQITSSKAQFEYVQLRPKKLAALVYATEELMEDSAMALDAYLTRKASNEISFLVNEALINGTGAGSPLGILNAPCKVAAAKESGQSADTIVAENILKMWSRIYAPCRNNAVWMINQECEPHLMAMSISVGTGGIPVYMPANGLSERPYGLLLGRPVLPTEWNAALGDEGDIILADWSQYLSVTKGQLKVAMSIHLRFDYDEMAWRFTFRIDGQPWWPSALTPYKGNASNTLSPFVTLAERA